MRILTLCALLLFRAVDLSGQYDDGTVRLAIPVGFEGPYVENPGPEFRTAAYRKVIPGTERGTLLQITSVDAEASWRPLPDSTEARGAESLRDVFLSGVERRRTGFEIVARGVVELSGRPAARAQWRGFAAGYEMRGVMYCVVVGSRIVSLHTQTFEDAPAGDMEAAIEAIESVLLSP